MDFTHKKKLFFLPFVYYYSLSIAVLIIGVYLLAKLPADAGVKLSFAQEDTSPYVTPNPEILLSANDEFKTNMVRDLRTGNEKCDETIANQIDSYFTKINAPLAGYGCEFVSHATENSIDPYLVAGIAIIESTGGKNTNYEYNAWGYGVTSSKSINDAWGAHVCLSWEDCIGRVSRAIARNSHKGDTPLEIAQWYNGGNREAWAAKLTKAIDLIKAQ